MKIYKAYYTGGNGVDFLVGYFRTDYDAREAANLYNKSLPEYERVEIVPYHVYEDSEEFKKHYKEVIIQKAKAKLTKEECEALGI